MKYCVYVHRNKVNGKCYVGQTKQKPSYRWRNGKGYSSNEYFMKAIEKYGWDGFEHIIIAENLTLKEANELEERKIKELRSMYNEDGYNILRGGDNRILSDATKDKIRKAHYGVSHICSDETKKKIGSANKGRRFSEESKRNMSRGQMGKKQSAETRKKHSEQLKQEWASGIRHTNTGPSPLRRSIYAYNIETGETEFFECISLAAERLGIRRTDISTTLSGRQKTAHGYSFKYAEDK